MLSLFYISPIRLIPMKRLLLFALILSSIAAHAAWVKGSITFKDNTVKTGYVKIFNNFDKKVEFKATLKDKDESYHSEGIKSVELQFKDGKTRKSFYMHEAFITGFTPKLRINKFCSWLDSVYEGDFKVLSMYSSSPTGTGGVVTTLTYYINWPGDNYATVTGIVAFGHKNDFLNKKYMRECNMMIFKCEKMAEAIYEHIFKPNKMQDVIEYYEKNCGSSGK
jgi:hypothetical protein